MPINPEHLEQEILILGNEIFTELHSSRGSFFDPQYYTEKFMEWAMRDEEVKVSMFRFVDVLPTLPNSASVIRHVHEYFSTLEGKIPDFVRKGTELSPTSLAAKVAAGAIKTQIRFVAERFIVGETPEKALPQLRKIRKRGNAFTVDLVGEATVSEHEARAYIDRYLALLDSLARETARWSESAPLVAGHRAEETPINISVKPSALYSQAKPVSTDYSIGVFSERFSEILSSARAKGAFVYVDMEDATLTTPILEMFKRTLDKPEFKDYSRVGIVLQAYLRRTESDLTSLISWVRRRGTPIAVRLVKGAYWDTETILAIQQGYPIPVWQHKANSDATYEALSLMLLQNAALTLPAFASHNIRSLCHAVKAAKLLDIDPTRFELQTLYGMADPIKKAFTDRGFLVREYAPVGELIPGMGYLVRRLLENTSNEGFLRQSFHDHEPSEVLLRRPAMNTADTGTAHLVSSEPTEFRNVPLTDFTIDEARTTLQNAVRKLLESVTAKPAEVFPIVDGQNSASDHSIPSIAPENPDLTVAEVYLADRELADRAVALLKDFFPAWKKTPVEERAEILLRTADLLEERRAALSAAIIFEAGKPWVEADADVAEAIDFLRYYAAEAVQLFRKRSLTDYPGERNYYFYEPRGITLVISPWNFPLAIPCGMFAAALVTGNCAILKPAEQTSLVASLLFGAFLDAGLPEKAAAFLPGIGEDIGAYLADHPAISTVVFTGSRDVGLSLISRGAEHRPGAEHVKRIIAEMGGKNAIIVDDDADLDEAVKGVIYSAFGYQGQKCSACSRVIIVGDTYERFLERLIEATKSVHIGPASLPTTLVGPVIDADAFRRINSCIAEARNTARLIAEGVFPDNLPRNGYYIKPTVFADVAPEHPLFTKEIFGPVLAALRAETFTAALELALNSEYGLTGAVFSRSPRNIDVALEHFNVGNLYINRGCTGAQVLRQPFGGSKMSGVGSKAGGPDYLHQFVIPRAVTENTMRRGFAPAGESGV